MLPLVGLSLFLIPAGAVLSHLFAHWMRRASLGQRIREYGPKLHEAKSGTPTMGGAVILLLWSLFLPIVNRFFPLTQEGLFIFFAGITFGGIGFLDDFLSLSYHRSLGLRAREKIVLAIVASLILFFAFRDVVSVPLVVPFSRFSFSLATPFLFLLLFGVFLSTTNSMNLTDGLDGLASGVFLLILFGDLMIAPRLAAEIIPLLGITIGFLWVNSYPADLFLGDVGSFALGGIVAAIALSSGTSLILPLLAGLLVLESASVILQVAYFRMTGGRIFKISPFHHHFERAEGIDYPYLLPNVEWPEPRIVLRLWIVQAMFVGLGILAVYR